MILIEMKCSRGLLTESGVFWRSPVISAWFFFFLTGLKSTERDDRKRAEGKSSVDLIVLIYIVSCYGKYFRFTCC